MLENFGGKNGVNFNSGERQCLETGSDVIICKLNNM